MAKRTAEGLAAAEQRFKAAIELDPDYPLAYISLADTYDLQADYAGLVMEESLERRQPLVDKALELDPLSGEAYAARATIHRDRQELEAAEEDFLKAIELNPSYATAHHWYSLLLRAQGRFEEGLAQIRVAAELDPMAPVIQETVAESAWSVGRVEEALTLLRRGIEQNPEFPGFYRDMAFFQTRLGHVGEAQRWNQKARKRNPEGPDLWRQECFGFLNLGDPLSAENCVNQLSEVHPEKSETFLARLWLQIYRGEWKEVFSTREALLERSPGNRNNIAGLADSLAQRGDIERARRLMADAFPEYLEDGLELAAADLWEASIFAAILNANGETPRRDVLLLAMEERMATMHRTRGWGYGVTDMYIHAMRGDRDRAIAALHEAIDVGWRNSWWMLRQDWKLESLHQDPEFIALLNELEADILKQRQWYEENKDKPLSEIDL